MYSSLLRALIAIKFLCGWIHNGIDNKLLGVIYAKKPLKAGKGSCFASQTKPDTLTKAPECIVPIYMK